MQVVAEVVYWYKESWTIEETKEPTKTSAKRNIVTKTKKKSWQQKQASIRYIMK